jgi:hypothetical protein
MGGISAARHKITGTERQKRLNADDPATGPAEMQGERSSTKEGGDATDTRTILAIHR